MGEFVIEQRSGHVLTLTLNRPEVLNAMHSPAHAELDAAFERFGADDDLWVAIVTGAGRAFCAGSDLRHKPGPRKPGQHMFGHAWRPWLTKPVIAAVNGLAYGGGWELVLGCDIVVADPAAKFALSEPRVGLAALGGGAARLPLRMPYHLAMELLLTGRAIDAATAHARGLVNAVSEPGEVMALARRYAEEILLCAPRAVAMTKAIATAAIEPEGLMAELGETNAARLKELFATEDSREGRAAFLEKRAPRWSNR